MMNDLFGNPVSDAAATPLPAQPRFDFGDYEPKTEPLLKGQRKLYTERAESYAWFRREIPVQGQLFESAYHIGWRRVYVCRTCLLAELDALRKMNAALRNALDAGEQHLRGLVEKSRSAIAAPTIIEPAER